MALSLMICIFFFIIMNVFVLKLCDFGLFSGNELLKATVPIKDKLCLFW